MHNNHLNIKPLERLYIGKLTGLPASARAIRKFLGKDVRLPEKSPGNFYHAGNHLSNSTDKAPCSRVPVCNSCLSSLYRNNFSVPFKLVLWRPGNAQHLPRGTVKKRTQKTPHSVQTKIRLSNRTLDIVRVFCDNK